MISSLGAGGCGNDVETDCGGSSLSFPDHQLQRLEPFRLNIDDLPLPAPTMEVKEPFRDNGFGLSFEGVSAAGDYVKQDRKESVR